MSDETIAGAAFMIIIIFVWVMAGLVLAEYKETNMCKEFGRLAGPNDKVSNYCRFLGNEDSYKKGVEEYERSNNN